MDPQYSSLVKCLQASNWRVQELVSTRTLAAQLANHELRAEGPDTGSASWVCPARMHLDKRPTQPLPSFISLLAMVKASPKSLLRPQGNIYTKLPVHPMTGSRVERNASINIDSAASSCCIRGLMRLFWAPRAL